MVARLSFCLCRWFTCMYVCALHVCLVLIEARKEYYISMELKLYMKE